MERYTNTILNKQGKPVAGAVVMVTTYPGNEPATIYGADGGQPVESVSSDENGRFAFYAADGHYNLSITGAHIDPFTITDIVLNDPSNEVSSTALSASGGAALVGFQQAGNGAVPRKVQDKLRDVVSVVDFGARPGMDAIGAFQKAIDMLPPAGGRIVVPDGVWTLSAQPSWGTKSIYWDFAPGATFIGAGTGQNKFPSMKTNGGQIAAGPYIQSHSRVPYQYSSAMAGGVAAFQVEMLQPADVVGQSVAIYAGAEGSNPSPDANVWAANFLVKSDHGAGGVYQGIEVDIDVLSEEALMKGISINGIGDYDADVGLELIRADETRWRVGIDILCARTGIQVRNTEGMVAGVTVGEPAGNASVAFSAKLLANGGDGLVLQRFTDDTPIGHAIRLVNAANSQNIATLDVLGNLSINQLSAASGMTTPRMLLTAGAVSGATGQIAMGNTVDTTASAGTRGAPPAQVAGYLTWLIGSSIIKIPYYNP